MADVPRRASDRAADSCPSAELLAEAFTEHGFAASVQQVGVGLQLCQHHCPVGTVAARFPQLCEAEFAVLGEALGTYAQRLATIARGDSFCTTFIPTATLAAESRPAARRAHPTARRRHLRRRNKFSCQSEQGRNQS